MVSDVLFVSEWSMLCCVCVSAVLCVWLCKTDIIILALSLQDIQSYRLHYTLEPVGTYKITKIMPALTIIIYNIYLLLTLYIHVQCIHTCPVFTSGAGVRQLPSAQDEDVCLSHMGLQREGPFN